MCEYYLILSTYWFLLLHKILDNSTKSHFGIPGKSGMSDEKFRLTGKSGMSDETF